VKSQIITSRVDRYTCTLFHKTNGNSKTEWADT